MGVGVGSREVVETLSQSRFSLSVVIVFCSSRFVRSVTHLTAYDMAFGSWISNDFMLSLCLLRPNTGSTVRVLGDAIGSQRLAIGVIVT